MIRAPDVTEEIIGYRSWNVLPEGELIAMFYGALWRPGINKATCYYANRIGSHRPAHTVPNERCGCGFYGLYGMHAEELLGCVSGLIAVWGDVCLHSIGFRAQYARIIAVDADYLPAHQLSGMRSFYGPELIICGATELQQIAESGQYGRLVSKEQRPGSARPEQASVRSTPLLDLIPQPDGEPEAGKPSGRADRGGMLVKAWSMGKEAASWLIARLRAHDVTTVGSRPAPDSNPRREPTSSVGTARAKEPLDAAGRRSSAAQEHAIGARSVR